MKPLNAFWLIFVALVFHLVMAYSQGAFIGRESGIPAAGMIIFALIALYMALFTAMQIAYRAIAAAAGLALAANALVSPWFFRLSGYPIDLATFPIEVFAALTLGIAGTTRASHRALIVAGVLIMSAFFYWGFEALGLVLMAVSVLIVLLSILPLVFPFNLDHASGEHTVPCPYCGKNIPKDAMDCIYCGKEVYDALNRK